MPADWGSGFCIAAQSDAAIKSVLYLGILCIWGPADIQVVSNPTRWCRSGRSRSGSGSLSVLPPDRRDRHRAGDAPQLARC